MDNGISIVHFFTCIQQKFQTANIKAQKVTELRFEI
jgi:hypothetical protein